MFSRSRSSGKKNKSRARFLGVEALESRCLLSVVTVNAAANQHAINPDIYGVNWGGTTQLSDLNATLNREGGTPTSTYNWQANASNRGNDWYFESLPDGNGTPGGFVDNFIASTQSGGAQPIITVPTLPWVAKLGSSRSGLASFSQAKYGAQTDQDPNWPDAGNGILASTGQDVTGNSPQDAYRSSSVNYQLGWVNHLLGQFGTAANGGVDYYSLDNEPGIWHVSHRDVHPIGAKMDEVLNKMLAYGSMIRAADPSAQILGPDEWNYQGYLYSGFDLQYADAHNYNGVYPDRAAHGNMDYIPYLLEKIHQHDQATGTRILDYLSVHYYPQGDAAGHQEFSNDVSRATELLRNRSTRSLWDPNYTDVSYVNANIDLIPTLQKWVKAYYPGTKVGLTEYSWGADGHMNGATAEADALGIFGRQRLDMAVRWEAPPTGSPAYNAIKMYRNYDGKDSTFGDTSVSASGTNPDYISEFAAKRSSDGALTIMLDDKTLVDPAHLSAKDTITVNLQNYSSNGTVQFYLLYAPDPTRLTKSSIVHLADGTITGNSFTVNVPRQSVLLAVVEPAVPGQGPAFVALAGQSSARTEKMPQAPSHVQYVTASTANHGMLAEMQSPQRESRFAERDALAHTPTRGGQSSSDSLDLWSPDGL
jgi:hypothetical protein